MEALGVVAVVIIALVVLIAVVVGIRFIPDLVRYRRLRKM